MISTSERPLPADQLIVDHIGFAIARYKRSSPPLAPEQAVKLDEFIEVMEGWVNCTSGLVVKEKYSGYRKGKKIDKIEWEDRSNVTRPTVVFVTRSKYIPEKAVNAVLERSWVSEEDMRRTLEWSDHEGSLSDYERASPLHRYSREASLQFSLQGAWGDHARVSSSWRPDQAPRVRGLAGSDNRYLPLSIPLVDFVRMRQRVISLTR